MFAQKLSRTFLLACAVCMLFATRSNVALADDLLIADRVSDNIYRYDRSGAFEGVVLADNSLLDDPTGIAVSPDSSKLYIANSGNDTLVSFDYDQLTGIATNGTVIADGSKGLLFPNSVKFSQDGSKIYVSNLGGSGVTQLTPSGALAGAPINGLVGGGAFFQFSGLAFAPSGELLVGAFQDFPGGATGAVAKSDPTITTLGDFVAPNAAINGAAGLMVNGNDLYVTGLFGTPLGNGALLRFDATTGVVDSGFAGIGGVYGLASPQSMIPALDGNGFLLGQLGYFEGGGNVSRFGFDGSFLGTYLLPGPGTFTEATAFATVVPEPTSIGLMVVACAALGLALRGRTKR